MNANLNLEDETQLLTAISMYEEIVRLHPGDTEALDVINEACHMLGRSPFEPTPERTGVTAASLAA